MAEEEDRPGILGREGDARLPAARAAPWIQGFRLDELTSALGAYEQELARAYESWRQGERRAAAEAAVLAARDLGHRLGFGIINTPLTMFAGGLNDLSSGKALDWLKPNPEAGMNNARHRSDKYIQAAAVCIMQVLWHRTNNKEDAKKKVTAAMAKAGYHLGGRRELTANTIEGWYERRRSDLAAEEGIWSGKALETDMQQGMELSSDELLELLQRAVRNAYGRDS